MVDAGGLLEVGRGLVGLAVERFRVDARESSWKSVRVDLFILVITVTGYAVFELYRLVRAYGKVGEEG